MIIQFNIRKMKSFVVLLVLTIIWNGCSSSLLISVSTQMEMNEQVKGRDAVIELNEGTSLHVKDVKIFNDSVSCSDRKTNLESRFSTKQINEIKFITDNDYLLGGLEGFGIGGLSVAGIALVLAGSSSKSSSTDASVVMVAVIFVAGLIGGVIGFFIGLVSGHTDYNVINFHESTTSKIDSLNHIQH